MNEVNKPTVITAEPMHGSHSRMVTVNIDICGTDEEIDEYMKFHSVTCVKNNDNSLEDCLEWKATPYSYDVTGTYNKIRNFLIFHYDDEEDAMTLFPEVFE